MSQLGQSLPGRANSKSGHVPCASKAEVNSELGASEIGICERDALDVKSSQRPIERWHGAISENLARTLSHRCAG
jgi:hypothetical protein